MSGRIGRGYVSRTLVDKLSITQRAALMLHIDRSVGVFRDNGTKLKVTLSLMDLHLIRGDVPGYRPKYTVLTDAGRQAVSMLLGDYADALVRAGFTGLPDSPVEILAQLKAIRKSPVSAGKALEPARIAVDALEK